MNKSMSIVKRPRAVSVVDKSDGEFPIARIDIAPPNFKIAKFRVRGTSQLVINRFSAYEDIGAPPPGEKRKKSKLTPEQTCNKARYISEEGWDGFPEKMVRDSMIAACRFTDAKQVNAKGSIFAEADGIDKLEPQHKLIKIQGCKFVMQHDKARNRLTGAGIDCYRPAYREWFADVRIRYDADQFSLESIGNLLLRAGMQIGWGVGRPSSSRSNGMGWGTFTIDQEYNK